MFIFTTYYTWQRYSPYKYFLWLAPAKWIAPAMIVDWNASKLINIVHSDDSNWAVSLFQTVPSRSRFMAVRDDDWLVELQMKSRHHIRRIIIYMAIMRPLCREMKNKDIEHDAIELWKRRVAVLSTAEEQRGSANHDSAWMSNVIASCIRTLPQTKHIYTRPIQMIIHSASTGGPGRPQKTSNRICIPLITYAKMNN